MYQDFKILSIREILLLCTPEMFCLRNLRVIGAYLSQMEQDHPAYPYFENMHSDWRVRLFMVRNPQYADLLATYEGPADEY